MASVVVQWTKNLKNQDEIKKKSDKIEQYTREIIRIRGLSCAENGNIDTIVYKIAEKLNAKLDCPKTWK